MNPALTRRQILQQVQDGEMSVQEAAAALRGAAPTVPDQSTGQLTMFAAGWEPAPDIPLEVGGSEPDLVTVLDGERLADGADLTVAGIIVRTTTATGFHSDPGGGYTVGAADDQGWEELWTRLDARGLTSPQVVVVTTAAPEHSLDTAYPLARTLIRRRHAVSPAVVFTAVGPHSAVTGAALGAFCQIASLEDRRLTLTSVSLPAHEPTALAEIIRQARTELSQALPELRETRYLSGTRSLRRLRPVSWPADTTPLSHGGIYLLSGGAGGIGLRMADLLARTTGARMVLLGRSDPTARTDEACRRIQQLGGDAQYIRADVTRHEDAAAAANLARTAYGSLTGVLHLAGINKDAYVVNKAPGAHRDVLSPKIVGVRNLDDVTRHDPLEMFVIFSSVAAYLGAPGQTDYAAASRALSSFATARSEQVKAGHRKGRTVAVAWPLWADGGMTLSERDRLATQELQGITAMPTIEGWNALQAALIHGTPDVLVGHGDPEKIRRYLSTRCGTDDPTPTPNPTPSPGTAPAPAPAASGSADAERFLLTIVSDVTRIPPDRLYPDQEFSAIGVDSVLIRRMSAVLEDKMGPLPATLFFEYRTVRELAAHLAEAFAEPLRSALVSSAPVQSPPLVPQQPAPVQPAAPAAVTAPRVPQHDDIAIIGVAGRYPGARDLDEFWAMLREGRDAITEVPPQRWDHHRYFGTDRRPGTSYGRWGGFIDDVRRFDSLFFAIAPREAQRMDPAERLFLEVAWSAIESGGYTPRRLQRSTTRDGGHAIGVYVGTTGLGYQLIGAEQWGKGNPVSAHSMDFSLANRLSYLLDAHGPSMVIDTACSASLTALHVACEGLRHGDCRVAIAGGAYLNLHPSKYAMLAEQRMISHDGTLRAFGDGADGFVPGEGIGAVLLKPLTDAIADGDHVYGVILGTAINHGGRTNGYTVPSPRSQAEVVTTALRNAGVEPATISYVEAHGTGTELGDPIEFDGLRRAFGDSAAPRQHCALGSVKPAIGHAEAAAGIAGLTKVLLQLQHRELVPTLHSSPPNPRINVADSPFRLLQRTEAWQSAQPGAPRRAAVSSFGAGGANAHVVVEEHLENAPTRAGLDGAEELILLSARTPDRLGAVTDRLIARLADPELAGRLADIAYTLQVGREAHDHRLAVCATSVEQLRDRLVGWRRDASAEHVRFGHVTVTGAAQPSATDLTEALKARRWNTLAALWAGGSQVDWQQAPRHQQPRTVPLPTYPFAGPEHWPPIDEPAQIEEPFPLGKSALPAYLIRVSGDHGQSTFDLRLDQRSPVVADHVIAGRPLLAGVAQLAAARAAAGHHGTAEITVVEDVRWRTPLEVGLRSITVQVSTSQKGLLTEVRSADGQSPVVHSTFTMRADALPGVPPLDVNAVQARCQRETGGEALYQHARAQQLQYGPLYRRVRTLWSGDGEALSALAPSPANPDSPRTDWPLDPGILDAALHTVHGALPEAAENLTVPAAAARIELHGPSTAMRWAHARRTGMDLDRGTATFDLLISDDQGRAVVTVTGLRIVRRADPVPYYRPAWRIGQPVPARPAAEGPVLVLNTRHDHGLGDAIAAASPHARRVDLDTGVDPSTISGPATIYFLGGIDSRWYDPADPDHMAWSRRTGPHALLAVASALAAGRERGIRLVVVTSDAQQTDPLLATGNPLAASLHGLARTISRELPFVETVCVDLDRAELEQCASAGDWSAVRGHLAAEPAADPMTEVAWRGGVRLEKTLVPARPPVPAQAVPGLRRNGRYLLVGGAGGLGHTLATHLAGRYQARLMIAGRRPESDLPPGQIDGLRAAGAQVRYLQADITSAQDMRAITTAMHTEYGGIDGVIHTAFVLADRTLARMDPATFDDAYAPKALGTATLCAALTAENLDFIAVFSSAIAHTGNPGQANYAAGSAVQDALGKHFAARHHLPVQIVDWGYWGEHGAVAGDDYRERMSRAGVGALTDVDGIAACELIVGGGADHVVPVRAGAALAAATPIDDTTRHDGLTPRASALPPIRHALRAHLEQAPKPFPAHYLSVVDAYSRQMMYRSLTAAGALPSPGTTVGIDNLATAARVVPGQRPLHDAVLLALRRGGQLTPSGDGAYTVGAGTAVERDTILRDFPTAEATLALIDECAAALPDVLSGNLRGLDVLFPKGSQERMAAIYAGDPRVQHFNTLTVRAADAFVAARLAGGAASLRILEIGAGTGGTSDLMLQTLRDGADRLTYDYTDISPTLVHHARQRFAWAQPWTRFDVLDITDTPPADRDYDLIIATNVLHATADIRRTTAHVSHLLAAGGVLLLNEATVVLDSVTLIFGLTEGWWLTQDQQLRLPHSPLLGRAGWAAVLTAAGLQGVQHHAVDGWPDDRSAQHLIVAEQGRWRHRLTAASPPAGIPAPAQRPSAPAPAPAPAAVGATAATLADLTRICADVLRVPEEDIETDADLSTYGADSLLLMELLERLERAFGPLPAHTTQGSLDDIAQRLIAVRSDHSATHEDHDAARSVTAQAPATVAAEAPGPPARDRGHDEPIAIVGVAGRYPGADDLEQFWTALRAGTTLISHDTPVRSPGLHGFHPWGAHLSDIEYFDPLLFRISPVEAERMDPAERQLLQVAWETFEDAGYPPADAGARRLGAEVGVFIGAMHTQYEHLALHHAGQPGGAVLSTRWGLANRISHCFKLRGPSMAVDTACSSALTAIHLAVRSLRDGECQAALAGAVNLILHPSHDQALDRTGMLSPDGRPRVFAPDANGMITGEAVGAVLLKRLSDAVRDGDRIHGCILATRVNSDGGGAGYAVPHAGTQAALITDTLRDARLTSESISYVEAHATGSPVGDPVELSTLRRSFPHRPPTGSLKAAIGHTEAASGLAQLTKVLLQLRHDTIAPTAGTDELPADVPLIRDPAPWPPRPGQPRRAVINSFGAGGANAHLIVEEPPATPEPTVSPSTVQILPLSARKPEQLRRLAARLRDFLQGPGARVPLASIAWTLQTGRASLKARAAWLVHDHDEAVRLLDEFITRSPEPPGPAPAATGAGTAVSMAVAWQSGADVDWTVLHPAADRQVVSLPHYPFARERYWITALEPSPTPEERSLMTPALAADDAPGVSTAPHTSEIIETIAQVIGVRPADFADDDRLSDLGFDSVTMVTLAARLTALSGADVNPAILYGYSDVAALVAAMAATGTEPGTDPVSARPTPPPPPPASRGTAVAAEPAVSQHGPPAAEPVAIIGMAGAFPGSPNLDAFWQHLVSGDDLITASPPGRFTGHHNAASARWGGFLDDIDAFDADFFRISPREAGLMDPHHRLLLQTAWSAIEEAGYDPHALAGRQCGVFVGVASSEYAQLARRAGTPVDGQLATGNDHSMVANRLSFLLDLHGPSEPVDTACSSSLVAVHRAVQSLHNGDCELAIAGGVNVILTPDAFEAFDSSGMLAADGRCKSFDARADGYVRGEGVGALLLKPLSRALADGDHIHALVAGTAVNHGGRATSLTAPNPTAQADVLVQAWQRAGVTPDDVSYIEAHGTGTALGDPIEIEGLKAAFARAGGASHQQCGLGTVKSNVGHLETAAGVAGLIKVVMALRHRILPPTLHVRQVNPLIKLGSSPFHLITTARSWDTGDEPGTTRRVGGVSSFGYGGTNAHVVLTEAAPRPAGSGLLPAGPQLYVLSAQDDERLRAYTQHLISFLQARETEGRLGDLPPEDVAHTLRTGRPALAARLAVVCDSLAGLADALQGFLDTAPDTPVMTGHTGGDPGLDRFTPDLLEHLIDQARGGALHPLGQAWSQGADIAWESLRGPRPARQVSLPTYPFRVVRHWLPDPPPSDAPKTDMPAPAVTRLPRIDHPPALPAAAAPRREPAGRAAAGPGTVRRHVCEAVAEGIGIAVDDVDPHRDFGSYGVDSIGALRIMQQIQSRYGDHIPMAAILERAERKSL